MVFIYEDLRETIPVIQTTTGLEYDITTKIKKMVDTRKKSIGIVNLTESAEPQNQTISEILSQSYNIRPVDPANPIQGDISVLLVDGVEDSVSVDVLDNLRSFVARGGNIFMAQGRIKSDLQTQSATVIQSNIFDFLDEVGLHVNDNLVLDALCSQVTISQNRGFFRMNSAVDYNFFPMIRKFGDHVTVSGLEQLRLLFSSEIEYQATDVMDSTVNRITPLLITSDKSTTMEQFFNLSPIDNPAFTSLNEPGRVVGALTSIASNSTGGVSQIILISDSRFFEDGGASPENAVFLLNAVDYLMGDSDLVSLRSREITTRPLEEIEDGAKSRWKWINILLASVLVIIFGFARLKRDSARTKILEEIYE